MTFSAVFLRFLVPRLFTNTWEDPYLIRLQSKHFRSTTVLRENPCITRFCSALPLLATAINSRKKGNIFAMVQRREEKDHVPLSFDTASAEVENLLCSHRQLRSETRCSKASVRKQRRTDSSNCHEPAVQYCRVFP